VKRYIHNTCANSDQNTGINLKLNLSNGTKLVVYTTTAVKYQNKLHKLTVIDTCCVQEPCWQWSATNKCYCQCGDSTYKWQKPLSRL